MDFYGLPDIIRWAAYGLALVVLLWLAVYVVFFFCIIAATIIDAVAASRRARRRKRFREREAAEFRARQNRR